MRWFVLVLVAVAGCATAHGPHVEWGYQGPTGPNAWGTLSPEFALCKTGQRQSPIELADARPVALPPLTVASVGSQFTLENNGHTIKMTPLHPAMVTLDGDAWTLEQMHPHHPSEHTVGGERFPLELHLVHKDAHNHVLVIGLLVRAGEPNQALQGLWTQLPKEKLNEKVTPPEPVDVSALLPADRRYFAYEGSLTTPPCTEGVRWVVLVQPLTMSPQQIDTFAGLFPDDSRPIQPRNGRTLDESTP